MVVAAWDDNWAAAEVNQSFFNGERKNTATSRQEVMQERGGGRLRRMPYRWERGLAMEGPRWIRMMGDVVAASLRRSRSTSPAGAAEGARAHKVSVNSVTLSAVEAAAEAVTEAEVVAAQTEK